MNTDTANGELSDVLKASFTADYSRFETADAYEGLGTLGQSGLLQAINGIIENGNDQDVGLAKLAAASTALNKSIGASSAMYFLASVEDACDPNLAHSIRVLMTHSKAFASEIEILNGTFFGEGKAKLVEGLNEALEPLVNIYDGKTNIDFNEDAKEAIALCEQVAIPVLCAAVAEKGHPFQKEAFDFLWSKDLVPRQVSAELRKNLER